MNIPIKYGISVISILNIREKIQKSMKDIIDMGYDGFQSLPLKDITGMENNVFCYEDVWRPELNYLWQIKLKRIFDDLLQLSILFSKKYIREYTIMNYKKNKIPQISHTFGNLSGIDYDKLYEISPALEIFDLNIIKDICKNKQILVADTRHLVDYEKCGDSLNIDNVLNILGNNLAPVIHFQPKNNITFPVSKDIIIFKKILTKIKENYDNGIYNNSTLTIIIEYNPKFNFLSSKKSKKLALDVLKVTKNIVDNFFK